jgi:hypothetical protein
MTRAGSRRRLDLERILKVAEEGSLGRLRVALGIETQPLQHPTQAGRRDRHRPRLAALGGLAAQHDQPALQVDVAEAQRQHLALAHAGVERHGDHGLHVRRGLGQERGFGCRRR